ncbi:MAG: hypothetical protein HQL94_04645 [Magnetococcales bacterium]|nr:hypothetical protein [Magnetococcales bacterium]MBF0438516.1 hypothetical protein [Magnetococcales bacterium]
MKKRILPAKKFLKGIADGKNYRIIDFRGDYWRTMPGAIPVLFEYDIFFADEGWTQDMLGVPFTQDRDIVMVCETGGKSQEALKLFHDKNPKTVHVLFSLDGGWVEYLALIKHWTQGMRRQEQFIDELTDIRTSQERFRYLAAGLSKKNASWFDRLFTSHS